jgi:Ca-activated chloride channel family protein
MEMRKTLLALFILLGLPAASAARQQQAADDGADEEVERVSVQVVSVPVSVTDREGRFVADLRREEFRLTDNGAEQPITYFAAVEQPFSVLLLLDTSGSNVLRLQDMQEAAVRFVGQLRPQDRVLPVAFDNDVVALLDRWSGDQTRLAAAIRSARTGMAVGPGDIETKTDRAGKTYTLRRVNTRLYDAVGKAVAELGRMRGRKALILFTDGLDTASTAATYKSTTEQAERLDAMVYVVQYGRAADGAQYGRAPNGVPYPRGNSHSKRVEAGDYLKGLAEKTGGRLYHGDDLKRIADAFTSIAEELRRMYSIGYQPPPLARPGERRELKVTVRRERVAVRARRTYVFSPPAPTPAK